ncbi:MAG TPA: butyryl-CoA:acetate CoA-transferase [Lachnoclostridium sp.]|nr:butyryl-CoA:acetate CoA-transferase [Lachnoclostridium sp.]
MDVYGEYRQKLRTPDEAVRCINSGDWVDYTVSLAFPQLLDAALARRKEELHDVKIRGNLLFGPIQTVECDPSREHFIYNTWHCSEYERKLCDRGLCNYIPMVFHNVVPYYEHFLTVNVAMVAVTPMDRHGYFNLSCSTGTVKGIVDRADIVILEVNERLPRVFGGFGDCIHISEADYVVEGEHPPLPEFVPDKPTDIERSIAGHIFPYIPDGANLQLGIGGMPGVVGEMLAQSDLKDLGMHTELCTDAYVTLHEAGKLTNRHKQVLPGKGVAGFAFGTRKLYDWLDENPGLAFCPLEFVNDPTVIRRIDNMVSINECLAVDIFGQVSSESAGLRQISGTGGQLDFLLGASESNGGKAFLCLPSTYTDRKGHRHSNILPHFHGEIVTSPRSQVFFIVTEYGAVNLEGRSTWERAEMLVSVAHPDYRDELIEAAEKMKIWRKSNKR